MPQKRTIHKERPYREFGEVLVDLRKRRGLTQERVAEQLGQDVERSKGEGYGIFERGEKRPLPEIMVRLQDILGLHEESWKELCTAYWTTIKQRMQIDQGILPQHSSLQIGCVVLNDERDRIRTSATRTLDKFHEHLITQNTIVSKGINRQSLIKKIFSPGSDPIIIVPGSTDNASSDISRNVPDTDTMAVDAINALLQEVKIGRTLEKQVVVTDHILHKSDTILVGGPRYNKLTEQVNSCLSQQSWFAGFYFMPIAPQENSGGTHQTQWTIKHRHVSDVELTLARVFDANLKGIGYEPEDDGWADNFCLCYVGPNPLNLQKHLVIVAGLGEFGAYGVVRWLKEQQILKRLTGKTWDHQSYVSVVGRYRFDPQRMKEGVITSIAFTAGSVPHQSPS